MTTLMFDMSSLISFIVFINMLQLIKIILHNHSKPFKQHFMELIEYKVWSPYQNNFNIKNVASIYIYTVYTHVGLEQHSGAAGSSRVL